MYASDDLVRFGTSSFSWKEWVGPFYPVGTAPGDYLREYARRFDTVEVDATYYSIPSVRMVDGWAEKTPDGFLLCAKFPRSIVHGGDAAKPDPARLLVEDVVGEDRDRFVETMRRLGPRLGPLVLQFPYLSREAFPSVTEFLDRLDGFLERLPGDLSYAVEVRNRAWVGRALRERLARHRVAMVLVDQAWMPHGDEVEDKTDPVTADFAYVRLLGDRAEIERLTKTWEREVIDRGARLDRWARFLARLSVRGVRTLVYVNNHYAGHAPTTTVRLMEKYALERAAPVAPAGPSGAPASPIAGA